MLPSHAIPFRLIPAARHDAPRAFRIHLHTLVARLAAEPESPHEPPHVSSARALLHCAEMAGWTRVKMIRQLDRQFAAELFRALPPAHPLEVLGGKA